MSGAPHTAVHAPAAAEVTGGANVRKTGARPRAKEGALPAAAKQGEAMDTPIMLPCDS